MSDWDSFWGAAFSDKNHVEVKMAFADFIILPKDLQEQILKTVFPIYDTLRHLEAVSCFA